MRSSASRSKYVFHMETGYIVPSPGIGAHMPSSANIPPDKIHNKGWSYPIGKVRTPPFKELYPR